MERYKVINGNVLKLIAVITMTLDHAGLMLFGNNIVLRCIGRIAFPLFGLMIAEGCFYTRNKLSYFLRVFILGAFCQAIYLVADKSLYLGILITFSFSILTIYAYQYAFEKEEIKPAGIVTFLAVLCLDVLVCVVFPKLFAAAGFEVDYGIFGVLFPLFAYMVRGKKLGILYVAAGLLLLSASIGGFQWFCLASLIFIALYSGKRGKRGYKYFFYVYYPLHLGVIYLISMLM